MNSSSKTPPEGWLHVGAIGKPHGLKGEISVTLLTDLVSERTQPGVGLWANGEHLEIETSRPTQDKWLLKFVAHSTRDAVAVLRNAKLYAPRLSEDQILLTDLIGFDVYDQDEKLLGTVTAIVGNPASDLLEVDESLLIPSAFQVGRDDSTKVVNVSLPDGLIESISGS